MRVTLLAALALLLALSGAPGWELHAQQSPGYSIDIPSFIAIENFFMMCLNAPGDSTAVLLVGYPGGGPTPTAYGTVCLGFPFLIVLPIIMPSNGSFCIRTIAHCERVAPGLQLSLQFVALGPAPGQYGMSNCATLTFVNADNCTLGAHVAYSQPAYIAPCNNGSPACILEAAFTGVYPQGLVLGDPDGIDGDSQPAVLLTSPAAVQAFVPLGPSVAPFALDAIDPTNSPAGHLAGQLAIAKINVDFDDAGAFWAYKTGVSDVLLGDMIFVNWVHPLLLGRTVREVIALADAAVSQATPMPLDLDGNGQPDITFSHLDTALTQFNTNYVDGFGNNQVLAEPF